MGSEYSLSSPQRYIDSVAMGSLSSFKTNWGVISVIAFFLKFCNAVVGEKLAVVMQLGSLKIETMVEWWVKFGGFYRRKSRRSSPFFELRGLLRLWRLDQREPFLIVSK